MVVGSLLDHFVVVTVVVVVPANSGGCETEGTGRRGVYQQQDLSFLRDTPAGLWHASSSGSYLACCALSRAATGCLIVFKPRPSPKSPSQTPCPTTAFPRGVCCSPEPSTLLAATDQPAQLSEPRVRGGTAKALSDIGRVGTEGSLAEGPLQRSASTAAGDYAAKILPLCDGAMHAL